jgi:hypothetical protein
MRNLGLPIDRTIGIRFTKGQIMKATEIQEQDSRKVYEPPLLEIVSLRTEESLAGACKDMTGSGPMSACSDLFSGNCFSLGS